MLTEETKDNKTKVGCADFGCCNPEDFKKIVETKCECFSGQSDATDFSAMMKNMMGMCCGPDQHWGRWAQCRRGAATTVCAADA